MQPPPAGAAASRRDLPDAGRRRLRLLGRARRQDAAQPLPERRAGGRGGLFAPPLVRERHQRGDDQRDVGDERQSRARAEARSDVAELLPAPRRRGAGHRAPARLALRLRAADDRLRRQQDARPARRGLSRRLGALGETLHPADARQGLRPLHQLQAHAGAGRADAALLRGAGPRMLRAGHRHAALHDARAVQGQRGQRALRHRQLLAGRGRAGRGALERDHHAPTLRRAGPSAHRGTHRGHRGARRQCLQRVQPARGDPEIPPRRGPPHPHQDG